MFHIDLNLNLMWTNSKHCHFNKVFANGIAVKLACRDVQGVRERWVCMFCCVANEIESIANRKYGFKI